MVTKDFIHEELFAGIESIGVDDICDQEKTTQARPSGCSKILTSEA